MLSGETAIGKYPVESVRMMERIIVATEASASKEGSAAESLARSTLRGGMVGRQSGSVGRALAEAAVFAAEELGCRSIVVFTISGHIARRVAALRPRQRVIALTPQETSYRQLAITWGLEPYPLEDFTPVSDEMLALGDRALLRFGLAEPGEAIVVTAGRMPDLAISTAMKLHRVGDVNPTKAT
jgi:pyruvate kinase